MSNYSNLFKDFKMYFFFEYDLWFSSYTHLKVKCKCCLCTVVRKSSSSNFLENDVKWFGYPSAFRKRIVCTLSNAKVSRYKAKTRIDCDFYGDLDIVIHNSRRRHQR